jgi:VanZ family protein
VDSATPHVPRAAKAFFAIGLGLVVLLSVVPSGSGDQGLSPTLSTLGHVVAYGLLAICGAIGFPRRDPLWTIGLGLFLLSVVLEFGQLLVPGRTFSLVDMAANAAGVALGLWLHAALARRDRAE